MNKLIKIMLTAVFVVGLSGVFSSAVQATDIKVAHWMSPKHPMDRFIMSPWVKAINKMSNGSIKAKIFPGGALGKGPVAQYKRAVDGVADVTFGLPGFTSKLFPRTGLIELPGMAANAAVAADKLWDAFKLLSPEWKRVKVLALWTNENQVIMTSKKAVRSLADLKGMKIRVPSKTQGATMKALGAVPVFMPINRVYNAVNTGVIDGVMTGPSTVRSFKFHEVNKYFTVGLPIGRSPFFLVMNKKKWNSLSAEQKELIDKTTGRGLSVKASKVYMKAGKGGLGIVQKSDKHEIIRFSVGETAKTAAILSAHRAKYVAGLESNGIKAKAILKLMGVGG
jgi:TRAP-type C4-dicarboxylate transport system substrate-binding protein